MSGERALRLVGLGALIGIPAALVAALFLAAVHELEHWLWVDLPERLGASGPPWYLVVGLPLAGCGHRSRGAHAAARRRRSRAARWDRGRADADRARSGCRARGARLARVRRRPRPEAPLIALGSVVGLVAARVRVLGSADARVLSTAGSFSAISALFGGPVLAAMLLLEAGVGLGASLSPDLIPGSSRPSIGYLVFLGLGDWGGLESTTLSVPGLPAYDGVQLRDLVVAVVVGVLLALLVRGRPAAGGAPRGPGRARLGVPLLLLVGALAIGGGGAARRRARGELEDVLFSGQASIPSLVGEDSARIVLVLLAAKALAYASASAAASGAARCSRRSSSASRSRCSQSIAFDMSPTLAVAVGTAAGMTAMTRLILASLIIAALLVGTAGVEAIPVAALAAVAAWLTMAAIDERFPVRLRPA